MPVILPLYVLPTSASGPAYSALGSLGPPLPPPPLPPPPPDVSNSTISLAFSICAMSKPDNCIPPSSATSILAKLKSSIMARICFPPGPITFPIESSDIFIWSTLGTVAGSTGRGSAKAFSISPNICSRPTLAWSNALAMVSNVNPSHLISSWNVVIPSLLPATLKSIVPKASSVPNISDTITAFSSDTPPLSPNNIPIAIPAIGLLIGTPASINARHPPHTDAMELEPLLSVTKLSTRIVYGNSSLLGKVGINARSARLPCPTSLRPVNTRPVSPTQLGGNVYCK